MQHEPILEGNAQQSELDKPVAKSRNLIKILKNVSKLEQIDKD